MLVNKLDYQLLTASFTHCFHAGCPRKEECARYQISLQATGKWSQITILNTLAITGKETKCDYFVSIVPLCFAWGISTLYDELPMKAAQSIKNELRAHFDKTVYYRIARKERRISPQEQLYIRNLFRKYGILSEPKFDRYEKHYLF